MRPTAPSARLRIVFYESVSTVRQLICGKAIAVSFATSKSNKAVTKRYRTDTESRGHRWGNTRLTIAADEIGCFATTTSPLYLVVWLNIEASSNVKKRFGVIKKNRSSLIWKLKNLPWINQIRITNTVAISFKNTHI